jgi:16S rRNA processing protein RimM
MQPRYLVVAHVSRAQGLSGAVEIVSLTDYPERFVPGISLLSSPPLAKIDNLTIEYVDRRPKGIVLKFVEINSREEAEHIIGRDLIVPMENAVELPENEFWIHDIVGMDVYTTSGDRLGFVAEILRTGSNDVYVVKPYNYPGEEKEYLIPAIKEVVKNISPQERKIIIEPIPGLLE